MSTATCPHCNCSDIDTDPARGDSVCTNCGSVLEDNFIVSEVQFEESARGGSLAIGQHVPSDGKTFHLNSAFRYGFGKESRAITLENGRKKIQLLAQQLRLNQHCTNSAFEMFKLAVLYKFTRGRRSSHVIAACMYLMCRRENISLMLLDISDIIQVNVYVLGKTYFGLINALYFIKPPPSDPSLYILRFANRLGFKDKVNVVCETATRLVQRMKKDWIHTGRRPSGLCGAALLVAARMHNFNRTTKDIIKIVKVCETTLKKRLTEFGETPSSRLTLTEFMEIDLGEEQDPPAFRAAQLNAKLQALEEQGQMDVIKEISDLQQEIEKALEESNKKVKRKYAKVIENDDKSEVVETEQEESDTVQFITEETIDTINEFLHGKECTITGNVQAGARLAALQMLPPILQGIKPTPASLGLTESIEDCMKISSETPDIEETGELDLTGIDDEEINCYIMNEAEVKRKTDMWNQLNADYLKEMKEKEERAAKEKEDNIGMPVKKKRKVNKKQQGPANTAGEAIKKMLQEKRISNKINYDVLYNLTSKDEGKETSSPKTESRARLLNLQSTPLANRLASTILQIHAPQDSVDSQNSKSPVQRLPSLANLPRRKSLKLLPSVAITKQVEEPPKVQKEKPPIEVINIVDDDSYDKIIIEDHDPVEHVAVDNDDKEEEEDEEEETIVRAKKLLGHAVDEYEYDDYDYDYDEA